MLIIEFGAYVCSNYKNLEEARPELYPMNLWDLNSSQYRLKHHVAVVVEEWPESEFIAHWHDIGAIGYGETKEGAIENLKMDVIDLYEDLREEDESRLGKLPLRAKRILQKVVEEKNL